MFVPYVVAVGLLPQDISCKFDIEYIYIIVMNVGNMSIYVNIPRMYPQKLNMKSIGRKKNGTKYTESIMTPQRVNIEK